jgi:hypothetical protein
MTGLKPGPKWHIPSNILNHMGLSVHPIRHFVPAMAKPRLTPQIKAPCHVLHFTNHLTENQCGFQNERHRLLQQAQLEKWALIEEGNDRLHIQFQDGELIWHGSQVSSYTFIVPSREGAGFDPDILTQLPKSLYGSFPGLLVCACRFDILKPSNDLAIFSNIEEALGLPINISSLLCQGQLSLWSSTKLDSDGFRRITLQPHHLDGRILGRAIDHLIQAEFSIHDMATLSLAYDKIRQEIGLIENTLHGLMENIIHNRDMTPEDICELTSVTTRLELLRGNCHLNHEHVLSSYKSSSKMLAQLVEEERYASLSFSGYFDSLTQPMVNKWQELFRKQEYLLDKVERGIHLSNAKLLSISNLTAPALDIKITKPWLKPSLATMGILSLIIAIVGFIKLS